MELPASTTHNSEQHLVTLRSLEGLSTFQRPEHKNSNETGDLSSNLPSGKPLTFFSSQLQTMKQLFLSSVLLPQTSDWVHQQNKWTNTEEGWSIFCLEFSVTPLNQGRNLYRILPAKDRDWMSFTFLGNIYFSSSESEDRSRECQTDSG